MQLLFWYTTMLMDYIWRGWLLHTSTHTWKLYRITYITVARAMWKGALEAKEKEEQTTTYFQNIEVQMHTIKGSPRVENIEQLRFWSPKGISKDLLVFIGLN